MEIMSKLKIELIMFIYMCSAYLKFPVFQNLLYDKLCQIKFSVKNFLKINLIFIFRINVKTS